jgi:hypothetical protein
MVRISSCGMPARAAMSMAMVVLPRPGAPTKRRRCEVTRQRRGRRTYEA